MVNYFIVKNRNHVISKKVYLFLKVQFIKKIKFRKFTKFKHFHCLVSSVLKFKEIIFVNKILSGIQGHQYLCEVLHGIIIVLSQ